MIEHLRFCFDCVLANSYLIRFIRGRSKNLSIYLILLNIRCFSYFLGLTVAKDTLY